MHQERYSRPYEAHSTYRSTYQSRYEPEAFTNRPSYIPQRPSYRAYSQRPSTLLPPSRVSVYDMEGPVS